MGLWSWLKVEETQLRALVGALTTGVRRSSGAGPAQEGLREACARTGLQEKGLGRARMGVVTHLV